MLVSSLARWFCGLDELSGRYRMANIRLDQAQCNQRHPTAFWICRIDSIRVCFATEASVGSIEQLLPAAQAQAAVPAWQSRGASPYAIVTIVSELTATSK
jgi:hypothetical protein